MLETCGACGDSYAVGDAADIVEMTRREADGLTWRTVKSAGEIVHRCSIGDSAVDEACRIIATQIGCTPTEALAKLREVADATDEDIADIAVDVVSGAVRFD